MHKWIVTTTLLVAYIYCVLSASDPQHIVKKGDTLWDISNSNYQDPYKWRDIWEMNPGIRNPDLIYPGDSINLSPRAGKEGTVNPGRSSLRDKMGVVQSAPAGESTPYGSFQGAAPKQSDTRTFLSHIVLGAPFCAMPGKHGKIFPDEEKIRFLSETGEHFLQVFSEIKVSLGTAGGLRKGDTLQIYETGKNLKSFTKKNKLGAVVQIKGLVQITSVRERSAVGRLIQCTGSIGRSARVSRPTDKKIPSISGYRPYSDTPRVAQIIYIDNDHEAVLPYTYLIIDKGAQDGFGFGDGVSIHDRNSVTKKPADKVLGKGVIVRIEENSATVLVREVLPGKFSTGDFVIAVYAAQTAEGPHGGDF